MLCRPESVISHRDGLALRSLVYHEILSAYLNYVKARGYTSMFIWACPPMAVSFPACIISFHGSLVGHLADKSRPSN